MSLADRYRDFVDRLWHARDDGVIDELVAPDIVVDYGGKRLVGREAFRTAVIAYREAFGHSTYTIEQADEIGDRVWAKWRVTGSHTGMLLDVAPTHAPIAITGLTVQRFANGQMIEGAVHWDRLTLLEQLRSASSPGAIYRAFVTRVFEGGDLAAIPDFIDEDYVGEEEGGQKRFGHAGARRVAEAFRAGLVNLKYEIHELSEDGPRVFARWTVSGDHGGTLFGVPPTGRHLAVGGMSLNEMRNGRIWRGSIFWDRAALARQLSLEIGPGLAAMWQAP